MNWFALSVKSNHEGAVAIRLANKGYEVFLPLYRDRRVWSDRIKEISRPLFGGYIFCRFDPRNHVAPIVTTPGVFRIISFGNTPAPIADREIEAVRAITNSKSVAEPWPYMPAGAPVQITAGALTGVEGFFLEAPKGDHLIVSISLLQRSVAVQIDRACVRPLRAPCFSARCA